MKFTRFPNISVVHQLNYQGNRLTKVTDHANPPTYAGAMDLKDNSYKHTELTCHANSNLTAEMRNCIYRISSNQCKIHTTAQTSYIQAAVNISQL